MTKEHRIYNGNIIVVSINDVRNIAQPHAKE